MWALTTVPYGNRHEASNEWKAVKKEISVTPQVQKVPPAILRYDVIVQRVPIVVTPQVLKAHFPNIFSNATGTHINIP